MYLSVTKMNTDTTFRGESAAFIKLSFGISIAFYSEYTRVGILMIQFYNTRNNVHGIGMILFIIPNLEANTEVENIQQLWYIHINNSNN